MHIRMCMCTFATIFSLYNYINIDYDKCMHFYKVQNRAIESTLTI